MNPEVEYGIKMELKQTSESSDLSTSSDLDENNLLNGVDDEDDGNEFENRRRQQMNLKDELDDDDEREDYDEEDSISHEDLEHQQQQQPIVHHHHQSPMPNQQPSQLQIYQQNILAAAQMAQLLTNNHPASVSSSAVNGGVQASTNEATEKENIPICKYCSKQFANFSNLNHHVSAIHLNESKWVCSQCGKICSSKSNLKVHLRVHLRVKPYHCRWCSYACMHHSSIRDHLAKVHPDKVHTPLQPGYLFNSQAVPEPEVFNAKGFNANTFVNDAAVMASTHKVTERIEKRGLSGGGDFDMSPDKQQSMRLSKKPRVRIVYYRGA